MEFIVDNIVWFIVGGVVILMTIIGYLAEKTDFASKKYHDKMINHDSDKKGKPKEKKKKEKNVEKGIADAVTPVQNEISEKEDEESSTVDDLYVPLDNITSNEANDVPDELFAPLGATNVQENMESAFTPSPAAEISNVEAIEEFPVKTDEIVSDEMVNDFGVGTFDIAPEASTAEATIDNVVDVNNDVFEQSSEDLQVPVEANVVEETQNTPEMSLESLNVQPQIETQPEETLEELQETEANVENLQLNNIENVSATDESVEAPNENEETIDNEQFDKIFPDDPIIINENHKATERVADTMEPQAVEENQEIEDVWKF